MAISHLKRPTALICLGLALACSVALCVLGRACSPTSVSISFLGYTNTEGELSALFRLTNCSDARIEFRGELTASSAERNVSAASGPRAVFSGTLSMHDTYLVPLDGLDSTNGWRYQATTSVTQSRPPWQQRAGLFLDRVGVHLHPNKEGALRVKLGGARTRFPIDEVRHLTNSWMQ